MESLFWVWVFGVEHPHYEVINYHLVTLTKGVTPDNVAPYFPIQLYKVLAQISSI